MRAPSATLITIRRGVPDDAAALAAVYVAGRRAARFPGAAHTEDDVRAWFATTVLVEHDVWVAEADGRAVGVIALRGESIDQLYVRPEVQRRGIASRLLREARRGRARLRVSTAEWNEPARAFCEKHGFTPIAYGDGTGTPDGAPDVLYEWRGLLK
jgi:ribosomal protein S18 acetylase RimI-like enzyme